MVVTLAGEERRIRKIRAVGEVGNHFLTQTDVSLKNPGAAVHCREPGFLFFSVAAERLGNFERLLLRHCRGRDCRAKPKDG